MRDWLPFEDLEEARLAAGFFSLSGFRQELRISERTWYRWKQQNRVPASAVQHAACLTGRLDRLGWSGWKIENGVMMFEGLNPKYYQWRPNELLAERLYGGEPIRVGDTLSRHSLLCS